MTLYVAVSLDGFLADADGGVAWLDEYEGGDFEAFLGTVDCLLVGATTYERVVGFGEWPCGETPTYVVTSRDLPLATHAVRLVALPPEDLLDGLRRDYRHWLVGGARLARTCLRVGGAEDLRPTVAPVLVGDGVRLFGDGGEGLGRDLEFVAVTTHGGGLVGLHCAPE